MSPKSKDPIVALEEKIEKLAERQQSDPKSKISDELAELKKELQAVQRSVDAKLTPWQVVQIARHKDRPIFEDYISMMFDEFIELHGDRCFGDDRALVGGLARIGQHRVMLLGFNKGRSVEEKVKNNFGMGHPEGYRKSLRLMRLAEKYNIPIVCLIDTPAAYPGATAEARGQAEAIARNLTEMSGIEVPIVAIVTGEGGSGGALGIAVADVVMMLSNAVYSVIPPEGCAAILWRDSEKAAEAAQALKITAKDLMKMKIIDGIIPEPPGGAHRDPAATVRKVRKVLIDQLATVKRLSTRRLIKRRYDKYVRIGRFTD
jgi:acetyl-CoA carboxylase carboxyl transferase subunit alpha